MAKQAEISRGETDLTESQAYMLCGNHQRHTRPEATEEERRAECD